MSKVLGYYIAVPKVGTGYHYGEIREGFYPSVEDFIATNERWDNPHTYITFDTAEERGRFAAKLTNGGMKRVA